MNKPSELTLTVIVLLYASACGSDTPPLDQMPLRDALLSGSDSISQLDTDARQHLAARFEIERKKSTSPQSFAGATSASPEQALVQWDLARAAEGLDALLVGRLAPTPQGWRFEPMPDTMTDVPSRCISAPPEMKPRELRALCGRAGAILDQLATTMGARHLVRTERLPGAAIAALGVVYVNASWLIAMEPPDSSPVSLPQPSRSTSPTGPQWAGTASTLEQDGIRSRTFREDDNPPDGGSGGSGGQTSKDCDCVCQECSGFLDSCAKDACKSTRTGGLAQTELSGCMLTSSTAPDSPRLPAAWLWLLAPILYVMGASRHRGRR